MKIILLSVFAFLLGSMPTGLIISKMQGIDPRKSGSGNIGATNVLRTAGRWSAFFTLLGDGLKGALAVLAAGYFFPGDYLYGGIVGLCSIIGHNYSIFLRFKGGKGVATSLGVLSVYSPQTCLFTIIIWLMTAVVSKYSSLGALVSFGVLPLSILFLDAQGKEKLPIAFLMTVLLFIRHSANISRIIKGSESKMGERS